MKDSRGVWAYSYEPIYSELTPLEREERKYVALDRAITLGTAMYVVELQDAIRFNIEYCFDHLVGICHTLSCQLCREQEKRREKT